jgi:hypothetical protein
MQKLNLPVWTRTHESLLEQEIMRVRDRLLHYQGRDTRGTADQEDIAALEFFGGLLQTLVNMRRPITGKE